MKEKRTYYLAGILAALLLFSGKSMDVHAEGETTPSGIPLDQMEKTVDGYMEEYVGKTANGAAVVYIQNGKMFFSKGYGFADVENKIPVDPAETVFEYASISKTFTWTAVMQLAEQGKIDLNADINTYLTEEFAKELNQKKISEKPIRVVDLMNHRAGFGDQYFSMDFSSQDKLSESLEEALLKTMPEQIYEPDTVTAYSNYGAALGGYLVECVTGKTLNTYLEEEVFAVTGMDATTADPRYDDNVEITEHKAKGYGEGIEDRGWTYVNTYPDGSLNGTAEDLARFAIAFMEEDCPLFDSQETVSAFFETSYQEQEQAAGCAHGFWEYNGADKFYWHDGGHLGFTGIYAFSPWNKTGLVVLTNTGDEPYVPYGLCALILGQDHAKDMAQGETDHAEVAGFQDAWELDGMEFQTARRNAEDITSLYCFLEGNTAIQTEDSMTILCNGLRYRQTAPDFYTLTDDHDKPILGSVYGSICILRENGVVIGFQYGTMAGDDYLRVSFPFDSTGLLMQGIFFLLASLVLLGVPVWILLSRIHGKNRNKSRNQIYLAGMAVTGLLSLGCLGVQAGYLILHSEELGNALLVQSLTGILYFFAGAQILFFVLFLKGTGMEKENRKQQILAWILAVGYGIFSVILVVWHGYSFV